MGMRLELEAITTSAAEVSMTEDRVQDSLEIGLAVVDLFEGSCEFSINHDWQVVAHLNCVMKGKEPQALGHTTGDQ
jgi:hypothetical protein